MKQVFKTNIGIVVDEVPIPTVSPRFVLVKVMNSLISTGTETSTMRKEKLDFQRKLSRNKELMAKLNRLIKANGLKAGIDKIKSKLMPETEVLKMASCGYSCSGIVVETGSNDTGFSVGDYVACAGSGFASHAEYVCVPMNLVAKIPEGVTFEDAAFTTVASISMHGLRRAEVAFGDTIVIVGLGLLGLIAVQLAKNSGLRVIGVDMYAHKLELATKFGADAVLLGNDENLISRINNFTNGHGADAVLLYAASKSRSLINNSMKYCRRKGRVVIVGDVAIDVDREDFYKKEIDLVMSTSYGAGRYDDSYELAGNDYPIAYVKWTENRNMQEFLKLLQTKRVVMHDLISKVFGIDEAKTAFEYLVSNSQNAIGALFQYSAPEYQKSSRIVANPSYKDAQSQSTSFKSHSGIIRLGFIGAGGFVQRTHLPNAKSLAEMYQVYAICDIDSGNAKCIGKQYNAKYITTDYKEILADPDIDMVVIGTQHNSHGNLVIESLKANKHTFVEKPLTMYAEELNTISKILETSDCRLSVGFNRRFSILSNAIKQDIKDTSMPKHVLYRVNAGHIPSSSWVQNPLTGGGRIVGEACHFIDYISFLTGQNPIDYSYSYIPKGPTQETGDSFSLNLTYPDGSVGTLVYATIGSKDLSKEYVEVHTNGKSYILKDFQMLNTFPKGKIETKLKSINKGWTEELIEFAKAIRGEQAHTIDWKTLYATTKITIEIQDEINAKNH